MKFVMLAFLLLGFKTNGNLATTPPPPKCKDCKMDCYILEPCTGENEFGKIRFAHGDR